MTRKPNRKRPMVAITLEKDVLARIDKKRGKMKRSTFINNALVHWLDNNKGRGGCGAIKA